MFGQHKKDERVGQNEHHVCAYGNKSIPDEISPSESHRCLARLSPSCVVCSDNKRGHKKQAGWHQPRRTAYFASPWPVPTFFALDSNESKQIIADVTSFLIVCRARAPFLVAALAGRASLSRAPSSLKVVIIRYKSFQLSAHHASTYSANSQILLTEQPDRKFDFSATTELIVMVLYFLIRLRRHSQQMQPLVTNVRPLGSRATKVLHNEWQSKGGSEGEVRW